MQLSDYLTIRQAAAKLGREEGTVRRYCNRGVIAAEKVGWTLLISKREVARFARVKTKSGRPKSKKTEKSSAP